MESEYFNPTRLALARKRRGMTKTKLASLIDVTPRSLSAYESGLHKPSEKHIKRLSEALEFPTGFFFGTDIDELPYEAASFRSLSRMSACHRDQALAAGQIACTLANWIDDKFELPKPDIPRLKGIDPWTAAQVLRTEWGVGDKPVGNMVHLLEAHGVHVFSLVKECREVDAFSFWHNQSGPNSNVPFVFLNTIVSTERSRMDAAHELGHLVLHWWRDIPRNKDIEKEAAQFASAFLLPESSIRAKLAGVVTLDQLRKAKKQWGVSIAALVYRLHELDMLTYWRYNNLFIEMSQKGYRTNEPDSIERESSQVLAKIFAALREDQIHMSDIARELRLPIEELNMLVFGLVITGFDGSGNRTVSTGKPDLKLISRHSSLPNQLKS